MHRASGDAPRRRSVISPDLRFYTCVLPHVVQQSSKVARGPAMVRHATNTAGEKGEWFDFLKRNCSHRPRCLRKRLVLAATSRCLQKRSKMPRCICGVAPRVWGPGENFLDFSTEKTSVLPAEDRPLVLFSSFHPLNTTSFPSSPGIDWLTLSEVARKPKRHMPVTFRSDDHVDEWHNHDSKKTEASSNAVPC